MMESNVKKETPDDSINVTETTEEISDLNEGVVVKVEELHHSIEIEDDYIMEAESTIEDSPTCKSCENTRKSFSGSKTRAGKKPNTLEKCRHNHLEEPPPLEKNSHDSYTNENMSFKIIRTTESEHKLPMLVVVPATWENNGTLHWPKYASTMVFIKLIQDGFSRPQPGWESLPCVKIRDSFPTYAAAAAERDEMVLRSNNEAYQVNSQPTNFNKRFRFSGSTEIGRSSQKSFHSMTEPIRKLQSHSDKSNLEQSPTAEQQILVVADVTTEARNITSVRSEPPVNKSSQQRISRLKQPINKEQQLMLSSIPQETISSSCDMEIDGLLNGCEIYVMDEKQSNNLPLVDKIGEERNNRNPKVPNSTVVVEGNTLKMMLENQQQILNQQRKILEELAKQHTTLEFLRGIYNNSPAKPAAPPVVQQVVPRNDNTINMLPIDTIEKLQELELFLLDEENVNRLVEKMSTVCGTSGVMNGINCCYTLIDSFFNREFLTKFSWSGGSRNSEEKAPFKNNKNIIKVFCKIVVLADRQFSELECQGFFKSIVKNAKRRAQLMCSSSEKKRCSAGKRRPNNLIYNKLERRNENDDENVKTENNYIYIENQDSNSESEQESNTAD